MSVRVSLSVQVSPDVAAILEEKKKRAGRKGTRGSYLDEVVRFYERNIQKKEVDEGEEG